MRAIAEADFADSMGFVSLDGSAEEMPFDDATLDMIACGQSFHWFDPDKAREEFSRTLHGLGIVMLAWNSLDESAGGVSEAVQNILREAEAGQVRDLIKGERELRTWYGSNTYQCQIMKHTHTLLEEQIIPYARSRSYWPDPESDHGKEMEAKLHKVVSPFLNNGQITLKISCEVHLGQLG